MNPFLYHTRDRIKGDEEGRRKSLAHGYSLLVLSRRIKLKEATHSVAPMASIGFRFDNLVTPASSLT